jgi:hypothetical protein
MSCACLARDGFGMNCPPQGVEHANQNERCKGEQGGEKREAVSPAGGCGGSKGPPQHYPEAAENDGASHREEQLPRPW